MKKMQPVFSRNDDYEKIAFLNWRFSKNTEIRNLLNLANGFLLSAIELAKHAVKNNQDKRADILIFPILANSNHAIELYLKAIIWMANSALGLDRKSEGRHNIQQLYATMRARIQDLRGRSAIKEFDEWMLEVRNYIDELFDKIQATPENDKMDFSRYPFSTNFEDHFYVSELRNIEVDLENFIDRFTIILQKFEALSDSLFYQRPSNEQKI